MMPAAKHFDPVLGIDIHIVQPPGPVPPVPIPHPFVGFLIDPFDYVPIVGATVMVNGLPRAQAGTMGKAVPVHIPIGGMFVKPPANECEMFMGSATVEVDGDAFSFLSLPALSCQDIGMPPPPRINPKKKSKVKSLVLPTSVVLPIPAGPPVLVGGPPTISLMAMGMKVGMGALGKGLKRLAKSSLARRLGGAFKKARQKVFGKMKPGFLKCKVLRAEPVDVVTGEVVVEQQDFVLPGRIPLEWTRRYSSQSPRMGCCGYGWETPAGARLVFEADGAVSFYDGSPGSTLFPSLPENGPVEEFVDGAVLDHTEDTLTVRVKSGLTYHFAIPRGGEEEVLVERLSDLCENSWRFLRHHGELREMTDSSGRRIEVVSRDGRIQRMLLHHPDEAQPHLLVRYAYNALGDLTDVFDPLEAPYRFFYQNHCVTQHTDRNGLSFYYEYDQHTPQGRCVHSFGDNGLYDYHFEYSEVLGETKITDSLGYVTVIQYDRRQLPIKEIDPLGGETEFEYDDVGRTSAVIDPAGHRTEYEYDERGNLVQLTRPDGKTIGSEFDVGNHMVRLIDPNGAVWQQEWDSRGLLIRQENPLGAESRYDYDGSGRLVRYINPLGAQATLAFDTYGNLRRLTDALGHATELAYDALGKVTAKMDALGQRTQYTYDPKGRLSQAAWPSGANVVCAYDGEDNLLRYQDENGALTRLEYYGLGEIKRRIQPDGQSVEYYYDTEERLVAVTNQRGERYELKRDALGRIVEETDYWGQSHHYAYTATGYLRESVDPLGRLIHYETDPLGRIVKKLLPDPARPDAIQEETFAYDANGNLIACANESISITRRYDPAGRLIEERQGDRYVVSNTYDLNGNRITRTTEIEVKGRSYTHTVGYRFDALDQSIAVEVEGHAPLQLTRDTLGRVTEEELSPHLRRRLAYSPDGYLTNQQVLRDTQPLFDLAYTYDAAGNLIEKRDSVYGNERFAYDPLGRLIAHLDPQQRLKHYLTDLAGDRLTTRLVSHREADSHPWSREGEYDGTGYHFDPAGNLVRRSAPEGDTHFTWDANQHLIASRTNGKTTAYHYDPLGRRVDKQTAEQLNSFYWDGDALVGDVAISKDEPRDLPLRLREWIYYPDTFVPLALLHEPGGPDTNSPNRPSSALYFYHNDPNGCPTRMLDPLGAIAWVAQYGSWGAIEHLPINYLDNPLRLQGQYYDEETKLCYNRHRYYDPRAGQFISQDPLRLGGGDHLYWYARNIFSWTDPLGLTCKIQGIFPDTITKGVHIDATNGIELAARPGHSGTIVFKPVFSGEDPAKLRAAIKEAEESLEDPKWRAKLKDTADRATKYLVDNGAPGKSAETSFLSKALKKMG